jgi:S1-C subfamily serine protease
VMDFLDQLSSALSDRISAASGFVVAVRGGRQPASGVVWRGDVVVTSEQLLGDEPNLSVLAGDQRIEATLVGRDPGTNVAVLKLASTLPLSRLPPAVTAAVGSLSLVAGADAAGNVTGRLSMVHAAAGAWHSLAGGRIDALIRLDCRLGADEGGPVLAAAGGLLGMSTSGPRRRTIVIPTVTLARVTESLLATGRVPRGWLGVGLQPVMIPEALRAATDQSTGLMVVSLSAGAPAETCGMLPGDIVLDLDGEAVGRPRALASLLGAEKIGQSVRVRILRAGAVHLLDAIIADRPAG